MQVNERTAGPGKLITVTGIDGAGKTTLATALNAALTADGHDVVLAGKLEAQIPGDSDPAAYLKRVRAVVYDRPATVSAATGDHYWLFALAAWYTLQDQFIIRPALQAGTHVILDNSHHKILARYGARATVPGHLARLVFAHLSTPDIVLLLQVSPGQALARKQSFTPLETGHTGTASSAFLTYQTEVARQLRQQAGQSWAIIDVDDKPATQVLAEAMAALRCRLRPCSCHRAATLPHREDGTCKPIRRPSTSGTASPGPAAHRYSCSPTPARNCTASR